MSSSEYRPSTQSIVRRAGVVADSHAQASVVGTDQLLDVSQAVVSPIGTAALQAKSAKG